MALVAIKNTAPITPERRDATWEAVATGGDAAIAFTVLMEASLQLATTTSITYQAQSQKDRALSKRRFRCERAPLQAAHVSGRFQPATKCGHASTLSSRYARTGFIRVELGASCRLKCGGSTGGLA
jgi:hypothetical protein